MLRAPISSTMLTLSALLKKHKRERETKFTITMELDGRWCLIVISTGLCAAMGVGRIINKLKAVLL